MSFPGRGLAGSAGGHVVAGDAEQVQDGVQVGDAQRGVGRVAHHGLGVERDAEPGGGDHVEVVGAVADRHRLGQRNPGVGGEPAQRLRLPGPVDHRAAQPPGQLPGRDLQLVGRHVADAELGGQRPDHLDEAAADDARLVAEAAQRPDQRARARGQPQFGPDLVEDPGLEPGEQRHPLAQRRGEVELAAHGGRGHLRHLLGAAGPGGQQVDHLVLDEGGVHVHHDQPQRAPVQPAALDRHVDPLLDRGAGQVLAEHRRVPAGDVHLDAGHRLLREPADPVDVRPAGRDPPGDGGDGGGRQRAAQQGDVQPPAAGGRIGPGRRTRGDLGLQAEITRRAR